MIKDMELKSSYEYIGVDSIAAKEIENSNCITGDTNHLLYKLKKVVNKNTPIRIFIGDYLHLKFQITNKKYKDIK